MSLCWSPATAIIYDSTLQFKDNKDSLLSGEFFWTDEVTRAKRERKKKEVQFCQSDRPEAICSVRRGNRVV